MFSEAVWRVNGDERRQTDLERARRTEGRATGDGMKKDDGVKVAIARRLQEETTVLLKWIASDLRWEPGPT